MMGLHAACRAATNGSAPPPLAGHVRLGLAAVRPAVHGTLAIYGRVRRWRAAAYASVLAAALACPATAFADATAFLGVNTTPSNRTAKGFAVGITVLVVGVEFEYSDTGEDLEAGAPSLRTGSGNVLVQTPIPISGLQFYGTAGVGVYRERLATTQETNVSANIGGGVKISLLGPLKLRVDYRLFTLRGSPLHENAQRIYAGLNLAF